MNSGASPVFNYARAAQAALSIGQPGSWRAHQFCHCVWLWGRFDAYRPACSAATVARGVLNASNLRHFNNLRPFIQILMSHVQTEFRSTKMSAVAQPQQTMPRRHGTSALKRIILESGMVLK
jgi:hypothetical protein